MSQPAKYNRSFSFTNFQAQNPTAQPPGSSLDIEFNSLKTTLDQVLANLALIQNDDTTVKNASIGPNQLSSALTLGFSAPTTWITGTAYTASPASAVFNGSSIYICLVSHTSGTFATDLAAGKWQLILNLAAVPITAASQVSVVANGSLVSSDVQTSLNAIDAGKAASSHTHTASAISDSTAAGRAMLTAANVAAQQALLGLGSLAFLNSVSITAITGNLAYTGKISPTPLNSSVNDWSPTGLASNITIRASASTAINITGLQATTDGDIKEIQNIGPSGFITLTANDPASAAANRFLLDGPVQLVPGQSMPLRYDATAGGWRQMSPGSDATALQGDLGGLTLSNDGGSPNTVIDIASGACASQGNLTLLKYLTAFTKNCNAAWAVGTGNGALDSGSTLAATSWYHVFAIKRLDTGVCDFLVSLSTSPSFPANYTVGRRIGSFKTDGSSHIIGFTQNGDEFMWTGSFTELSSAAITTTPTVQTLLGVPPGVKVNVLVRVSTQGSATNTDLRIYSPDENAPGVSSLANGSGIAAAGHFNVRTSTGQQIKLVSGGGTQTTSMVTYGYVDTRGRFS